MRKTRSWIVLGCSLFAVATLAAAQNGKPGLWEVASATTFQKSSGGVGMFNGTQSGNATAASPQGLPVCLTQELIDKYGVILPPSLKDCELSNVVKKPNSMTSDMTCSGRTNGKGSIESTWSDENHVKGKIHFVGKVKAGPSNSLSMAWTEDSTAVFKSADCGSLKPRKIPAK
jgi:hypothetical protein